MLDVAAKKWRATNDIVVSLIISFETAIYIYLENEGSYAHRLRSCHSIRSRRGQAELSHEAFVAAVVGMNGGYLGAPRHVRRSRNPPEIRSIRHESARKLDDSGKTHCGCNHERRRESHRRMIERGRRGRESGRERERERKKSFDPDYIRGGVGPDMKRNMSLCAIETWPWLPLVAMHPPTNREWFF